MHEFGADLIVEPGIDAARNFLHLFQFTLSKHVDLHALFLQLHDDVLFGFNLGAVMRGDHLIGGFLHGAAAFFGNPVPRTVGQGQNEAVSDVLRHVQMALHLGELVVQRYLDRVFLTVDGPQLQGRINL